jgi:hypothetical protein
MFFYRANLFQISYILYITHTVQTCANISQAHYSLFRDLIAIMKGMIRDLNKLQSYTRVHNLTNYINKPLTNVVS